MSTVTTLSKPADPLPIIAGPAATDVAPEDRVPPGPKLAYASGQFASGLMMNTNNNFVLPVFVVSLGVSPALISFLDMVYRLWDAITDMLVGWLSDNTRTRWGRRRPYIFAGALLSGLWMPVLWLFDASWSMQTIILWMIGAQLLMYLVTTFWNIPYQCLLLEITPSSVERTNVAAARTYFSKCVWLLLSWIWFFAQLPVFRGPDGKIDQLRGALGLSLVAGVLVAALGVLPALFCRERYYHQVSTREKVPLLKNIRLTFRNRPFLQLSLLTLLFMLGTLSVESIAFFTRLYYVCGGDTVLAARLTGLTGTCSFVTGLVAVPVFQWIARRHGKRTALLLIMGIFFASSLATLVTYRPDLPYLSLVNGMLGAMAMTAIWMLLPSMAGDVVDHDELQTGERREGAFAAIFSWISKLAYSLALAVAGVLVAAIGFDAKSATGQSPEVMHSLRLLLAFVPTLFIGGALWVASCYRLDTGRINEIRAELEARRGKL
ncbi:sodium:melibiose symporter [Opitutaceae bacterium TAV5]|nr:sodium:melibiose symporter [Opitutaceae bacterium TAV5]